jgi:hypothetical protein
MNDGKTQTLFSQNTIQHITVYNEASKNESHTGGDINVKFTPTQKQAIQAICQEQGLKTSTFVREMVDDNIELFPYRDKLKRHRTLVIDLLRSLP